MRISIVFSFFNEEDVLDELLTRVRKTFSTLEDEYECVFVNDASTDRSLEILEREARKDPKIKIVNMSRNFGVSQCTLAGMRYATGDAVVMMDTDLQDPPEVIADLIREWKEKKADVVYTVRLSRKGEPALK